MLLAPIYLLGLLAAGIPVVIHLIYRRKAPRIVFSTLRFLRLSHEKTARVRKIHDLVLLAMRALLFGLLAVALAQPYLRPKRSTASSNVAAAIVLDNSCSMATLHAGESRFAAARQAAAQIVKECLAPADEAVLILTNPAADAQAPTATVTPDAVAQQIAASRISNGRGNLVPAVKLARKILSRSQKPNREVYLVTDLQQSAFAVGGEPDAAPGPPVFVVDVGRSDYKNLGVIDCAVRSRALVAGSPITIEARIANFSPRAETESVSLYVDNQKVDQKIVTIEPLAELAVPFTQQFDRPGEHVGHVVLEDDSLPLDNRRSFQLAVAERIPTLVVQDADSPVPFEDESFFLRAAIDPHPGRPGGSTLRYDKGLAGSLAATDLSKYRVVFLLNVQSLSGAAAAVRKYVAAGGGLVIFVGDRVDPSRYSNMLADETDPLGPLMPAKLAAPAENTRDDKAFAAPAEINYEHPALAVFRGTDVFRQVHIEKTMPADIAGSSARALITQDNGLPFLIENRYGSGSVFLFTTTANAEWTSFPLQKAYAPLLHELVHYVGRRAQTRNEYLAGNPVTLSFPAQAGARKLVVTSPSGSGERFTTEPTLRGNAAVYSKTDELGAYRWEVEGQRDLTGMFVVNTDPEESRLAKATPEAVRDHLGRGDVYVTESTDEMRPIVTRYRKGVPLWDVLFFLLLLIALSESFFCNYIMPRAQPAEEKAPRPASVGAATG